MKVMQTLGRWGGSQQGIFQYRRTATGVYVDLTVGLADKKAEFRFTLREWSNILKELEADSYKARRLTGQPKKGRRSMYQLVSDAVPRPKAGWVWSDSLRAAVCAILANEGSVVLHAGTYGPGHGAAHIGLATA